MIITTKAPYRTCGHAGRLQTFATMDYLVPVEMEQDCPEREALRRLLRFGCARCLDARERELIRLRYEEGKPLKVIAAREGRSVSAVSRKLRTARNKLYRFTADAGEIGELCDLLRRQLC